jgi:DNA-binding IclR family transcriptional regulator
MAKREKSDYTIKSVVKALKILEVFKTIPEIGVTELGNRLNIPKSSIYYFLATLESMGYVEQNQKNKKYKLGLKIFELGSVMQNRMELRSKARPYLQELSNDSKETVHLVILDKGEVVYIDKIVGTEAIQINSQIGKRLPAHCTGVGKVLLAYLEEKELEKIIKNKGLQSYTKHTITNPQKLKKELIKIRKQEYGIDREEFSYGLKCIAAPIRNYTGEVKASLSVSGPPERLQRKGIDKLIRIITQTATEISRNLGYNSEISL